MQEISLEIYVIIIKIFPQQNFSDNSSGRFENSTNFVQAANYTKFNLPAMKKLDNLTKNIPQNYG